MNALDAIDMAREAVLTGLWLLAPVLIVGLIVTIGIGFLQSMTQIHDATLSIIPRIVIAAVVIVVSLPWLASRISEYGSQQWERPLLLKIDVDRTAGNRPTGIVPDDVQQAGPVNREAHLLPAR